MPAIVSVKVVAARDLPVMDRSSELTDAFVEIRLGQNTQRTEVCKKTLNPVWDSPWLQFNTSVEELQDEPLTIK
jgi:Ca2+-dependent lipid-binding protein